MIASFKYYWFYFTKLSWMMHIVILMHMTDLRTESEPYFSNANREYGFWSRNHLMAMSNLTFCSNPLILPKRLTDASYENIAFDKLVLDAKSGS